jgi:hypothetical protein
MRSQIFFPIFSIALLAELLSACASLSSYPATCCDGSRATAQYLAAHPNRTPALQAMHEFREIPSDTTWQELQLIYAGTVERPFRGRAALWCIGRDYSVEAAEFLRCDGDRMAVPLRADRIAFISRRPVNVDIAWLAGSYQFAKDLLQISGWSEDLFRAALRRDVVPGLTLTQVRLLLGSQVADERFRCNARILPQCDAPCQNCQVAVVTTTRTIFLDNRYSSGEPRVTHVLPFVTNTWPP